MWNREFSRDVTVLLVVHELSDESNVSANSEQMIHNGQNVTLMWYPWKFFTLLRVDVTCTFWKGQIVSDWVSTWEFFGSLCFLHLDLSYMEFLERATMVNRTSSGSRSMKVLQTPKASYRHIRQCRITKKNIELNFISLSFWAILPQEMCPLRFFHAQWGKLSDRLGVQEETVQKPLNAH